MSSSYKSRVLAKGPVAYWRLGESSGVTAADETGNGHDGTYHLSPPFLQPGAIVDDPNTAVQAGPFYVEVPNSDAFSQPTSGQGLTVEAWMRPDVLVFAGEAASGSTDRYVYWLGKGIEGAYEWGLRFYTHNSKRPNRISAYLWNPTGLEGAGAYFEDALVPGQWIHVVACYEPGDMDTSPPAGVHIYKNGVHRLGPPSPGTLYQSYNVLPASGTAPLRLGTRDLHSFLTGGLDEVAIYPRVLTAEEIQENYLTALAPDEPG
jgi:hypothetical protein